MISLDHCIEMWSQQPYITAGFKIQGTFQSYREYYKYRE